MKKNLEAEKTFRVKKGIKVNKEGENNTRGNDRERCSGYHRKGGTCSRIISNAVFIKLVKLGVKKPGETGGSRGLIVEKRQIKRKKISAIGDYSCGGKEYAIIGRNRGRSDYREESKQKGLGGLHEARAFSGDRRRSGAKKLGGGVTSSSQPNETGELQDNRL